MKSKIYWIEKGNWLGQLAILPRPRGGDWLEDDVKSWKAAGIDKVVSLLEDEEISELELTEEERLCDNEGIDFRSFPIPDRGVPPSRIKALLFLEGLIEELDKDKVIGFHCRMGLGRSALVIASLLAMGGMDANEAFAAIAKARGCAVPDTQEQKNWANTLPVFARSVS